MNPVLTLTRNNLPLTKRCIESILKQDIDAFPEIIDNASSDGTAQVLERFIALRYIYNKGVSRGWNDGLDRLFRKDRVEHVLVVGNDCWLPPSIYRNLLSLDLPFVTGVAVGSMEQALETPELGPLTDNPDFSLFLIRRECWETVGPFDETMKYYAQDQDYHIRAHKKGVRLVKAPQPFFHERSSTIRNASPEERLEIETQAGKDRQTLWLKWGVSAGGADYEALFTPELFGVESTAV